MVIAQWRGQKWEVSAKKIAAIDGLSFAYEQAKDSSTSVDSVPTVNAKGRELFPLSFSTSLHSGVGVDIKTEIASWEALIGQTGDFILGGTKLASSMQLQKVSVGSIKLDDYGRIRAAVLSFSFLELAPSAPSAVSATAVNMTPSKADKASKKPSIPQISSAVVKSIGIKSTVKLRTERNDAAGLAVLNDDVNYPSTVKEVKGNKILLSKGGVQNWADAHEVTLV